MWIYLIAFWTLIFGLYIVESVREGCWENAFGGLFLMVFINASVLLSKFY